MSVVAVCDARQGVHRAVEAALELIGWRELVRPGFPTLFKVNLTHDLLVPGAIVSPAVMAATYRVMAPLLGPSVVAETSQVVTDADKAFRISGFQRVCEELGLEWCNMTHHEWVPREVDGEILLLPSLVQSHQVVNLCVMKTHFRCTMSGALKNFWGFLETGREKFHPRLSEKIAQLHSLIPCRVHLMDALVAMEGNGPKSGRPREVGLILASADPVALDATAARLMGFDPSAIDHIVTCARRGLGVMGREEISLVGDGVGVQIRPFVPAKENFVARVETQIRRMGGGGLQGIPLRLMAWGAKSWYRISYRWGGTRRRVEKFMQSLTVDGGWGGATPR